MEECGDLLGDLRRIDAAFEPSLQADAESLCADMLGARGVSADRPRREDDEPTTSCVRHAWAQPVELAEDTHSELLPMVRKSTPNRRDIMVYKLRDLPDDVLPGLEKSEKPKKQKTTKLENFIDAVQTVRDMCRIQLFVPDENPPIFSRLQIDAERLLILARNRDVFGSPTERRDIYAVRYDSHGARGPGPMTDAPGAPRRGSVAVGEIIDVRLLMEYTPLCIEEDAEIIDNIINTSSPLPDKNGRAIMVAKYSNNAAYGREYAMGRFIASTQQKRKKRRIQETHRRIRYGELRPGATD